MYIKWALYPGPLSGYLYILLWFLWGIYILLWFWCHCSGMTAKDTITAEMAFMFGERNSGTSTIDYPLEGSKGIVDALIRGIEKHGGRILLTSPVEQILVEGTRLWHKPYHWSLLNPIRAMRLFGITGGNGLNIINKASHLEARRHLRVALFEYLQTIYSKSGIYRCLHSSRCDLWFINLSSFYWNYGTSKVYCHDWNCWHSVAV